jgi:hypothetical protein
MVIIMPLTIYFWLSFAWLLPQTAAGPDRGAGAQGPHLFVTSDQCMACHNGLITPAGDDVSIGVGWRTTMMANSARDPYWQAAVRREVLDHPKARAVIENECAACHMPMTRFEAKAAGRQGEIFAHLPVGASQERADRLAADGVSCTTCHQIRNEGLGARTSFTAGFSIDPRTAIGSREIFGPFEVDQGRKRIMRSSTGFQPEKASHLESSEMCATCHTLITHTLGPDGSTIGELPEQVPYLEWLHSGYAKTRSCQSCHMPLVAAQVPISSVMGEPRSGFARHVFQGGNFFMPRVFVRHREQLGVAAPSQEFDAASSHTIRHLETEAARLAIEEITVSGDRLHAAVVVENLAGHKLPTAYPSRRVWIRLAVRDAQSRVIFESGAFQPDGSIAGNDNDADPKRFEPHYDRIDAVEQVQIYEAIMTGADKRLTTGLLTGLHYVKDNRLLPQGFDKTTAGEDIATHGDARNDDSFTEGRDRVRYSIPLGQAQGPFLIEAELRYQPVAYRWALNLRQRQAAETDRFAAMYQSTAGASATILAKAAVSARQ